MHILRLLLIFIVFIILPGCWYNGYYLDERDAIDGGELRNQEDEIKLMVALKAGMGKWWTHFGDESLNTLMEEALGGNLGLRASLYRIKQAEALNRASGAGYWPTIDFHRNTGYGGRVGKKQKNQPAYKGKAHYSITFDVSYDVDFAGAVNATDRLLQNGVFNAQDEAEMVALQLSSRIAKLWYKLGMLQKKLVVYEALDDLYLEVLESIKNRSSSDVSENLEILEYEHNYAQLKLKARMLAMEESLIITELAMLLGSVDERSYIHATKASLVDLVPETVLSKYSNRDMERVSVRVARRNVEDADSRIVLALADRIPSLKLALDFGVRASSLKALFQSFVFDGIINFVATLFDGFKKRSAYLGAKYGYESESLLYAESIQQVLYRVSAGIYRDKLCRENFIEQEKSRERLKLIFELSHQQYMDGQMAGYRLLDNLRHFVNSEVELHEMHLACLENQIDLLSGY